MEIITRIRTRYNTLSNTQKVIADYVIDNQDDIVMLSISELANACNTSETTVMRFLKKIDINSYQVFRVLMAQDLAKVTGKNVYEDVKSDDSMKEIQKKVIEYTMSSIKDLDNQLVSDDIEKAIKLIIKYDKVVIMGVGSSGYIAGDFYHKLLRLGIKAEHYTDSHLMSIRATQGNKAEIVILVSHSGESKEIIAAAKIAKSKNMKIISLTSHQNSTLSGISDITLYSASKETMYRSDAMISRILQLVIIDIICVKILAELKDKGQINIDASRLAVANKKR